MAALMMDEDTCRLIRESVGLFGRDVEQGVRAAATEQMERERAQWAHSLRLDSEERSALHASWILGTTLAMSWRR
jgi:hypothetical protein